MRCGGEKKVARDGIMHTRRTRKGVRAGQQSSIPIDQSHYLLLHHILFTKVMCWKSEVGILRCLTGEDEQ